MLDADRLAERLAELRNLLMDARSEARHAPTARYYIESAIQLVDQIALGHSRQT
jgi:hypothetical protein